MRYLNPRAVFRDRAGKLSCRDCAQRDLLTRQPQLRPSNPVQQRAIDANRVNAVTNRQRLNAVQKAGVISARENRNNDNGNHSASSSENRDQKKPKPKKDKKSKQHHKKPN